MQETNEIRDMLVKEFATEYMKNLFYLYMSNICR